MTSAEMLTNTSPGTSRARPLEATIGRTCGKTSSIKCQIGPFIPTTFIGFTVTGQFKTKDVSSTRNIDALAEPRATPRVAYFDTSTSTSALASRDNRCHKRGAFTSMLMVSLPTSSHCASPIFLSQPSPVQSVTWTSQCCAGETDRPQPPYHGERQ